MKQLNQPAALDPRLTNFLSWVVTLLIPVVLVMATVRILLTPFYLQFEYSTPGFPDDPFGFTKTERLQWSNLAVAYLINNADISYLADLRFPEGQLTLPNRAILWMIAPPV